MRSIRIWVIGCLGVWWMGCLGVSPVSAQTFSEWFAQKKTQKRYLLEQIAALEVYVDYARQGYKIVGSGIETVRGITSGELGLHELFFSCLRLVNPVVKGDFRVAEVVAGQAEVLSALLSLRALTLDAVESAYLASVSGVVLGECYSDLEELLSYVLSGNVDLSDEERLLRLESVYRRTLDKRSFVQGFAKEMRLGISARKAELKSIDRMRRYYGVY